MGTEIVLPFLAKTVDEKTFNFRRPLTSEIDRYLSRAGKAAVASSIDFTGEIVLESDRAAWTAHVAELPGAATAVAGEVLEKLGFQ